MPKFSKDWFDIISIFSREGTEDQISVHIFKQPYSCRQFFIPAEAMESPTFWEDVLELAKIEWAKKYDNVSVPCPRCGTTRANWKRWHLGRSFCGFCGLDIPMCDEKAGMTLRIPVK